VQRAHLLSQAHYGLSTPVQSQSASVLSRHPQPPLPQDQAVWDERIQSLELALESLAHGTLVSQPSESAERDAPGSTTKAQKYRPPNSRVSHDQAIEIKVSPNTGGGPSFPGGQYSSPHGTSSHGFHGYEGSYAYPDEHRGAPKPKFADMARNAAKAPRPTPPSHPEVFRNKKEPNRVYETVKPLDRERRDDKERKKKEKKERHKEDRDRDRSHNNEQRPRPLEDVSVEDFAVSTRDANPRTPDLPVADTNDLIAKINSKGASWADDEIEDN